MKTPFTIYKNFVSKRDAHPEFKWTVSLIVFILLFAVTVFSLRANADDRSKTEADGICIDCVVASLTQQSNTNNQFKDFKTINVAIFSSTPDGKHFVDPRVVMDRSNPDTKQLNAIGLVTVTGTLTRPPINTPNEDVDFKPGSKAVGTGTGFLINDCLVITNQHVTSLKNNAQNAKDLKITFSVGAPNGNGSSKFLMQAAGTVIDDGSFYGANKNDVNHDWAIVKLDKPLGQTVGHIVPIVDGTPEQVEKLPVASASFYTDKTDGSQLWGQKSCSIFSDSLNPGHMKTDCPSIAGVSGAPIFAQNPDNKEILALGLIEGGKGPDKSVDPANIHNGNFMVLFSKAFTKEHLKAIIDKNQCNGFSI
jgi:V8-like Glu-specific endopeptidase